MIGELQQKLLLRVAAFQLCSGGLRLMKILLVFYRYRDLVRDLLHKRQFLLGQVHVIFEVESYCAKLSKRRGEREAIARFPLCTLHHLRIDGITRSMLRRAEADCALLSNYYRARDGR